MEEEFEVKDLVLIPGGLLTITALISVIQIMIGIKIKDPIMGLKGWTITLVVCLIYIIIWAILKIKKKK